MERQEAMDYLKRLRDQIIASFETLEPSARFQRSSWDHQTGGGGEISTIRGEHFEKAAVNWSGVWGSSFPMDDGQGPFFATGVSLITHMRNPHAPTVHMNVRYIETERRRWIAGGYDLTPMGFPYEEDTRHFHGVARAALEGHGEGLYAEYAQNAKEYFTIPHRKKERGVGGIFFDHQDLSLLPMWKEVGTTFCQAIMPIYERRIGTPFSPEQKETQLKLRAHYVEFNLLYDRGTKFGFLSGGNPDAILCSMPPLAAW